MKPTTPPTSPPASLSSLTPKQLRIKNSMNPTPAPTLHRSTASTPFGSRLIPLSDGRPGLRGCIHVDISQPADASPSPGGQSGSDGADRGEGKSASASSICDNSCNSCLDFVASDATLDRFDEIITPSGWRLDSYQRNPVFQNAHQYGDIIFTLGRALITEVRTVAGRQALFQRIQFAVEANPMARIAHNLYKGKFLNAVSVGFIPIRWLDADGAEHPHRAAAASLASPRPPAGSGEGQREDTVTLSTINSQPSTNWRRRYLEQELLEVSAVGIPANPNALALACKSGVVAKSDLRELADLIRLTLDPQKPTGGSPSPRGEGRGEGELSLSGPDHASRITHHATLLPLLRQLRDLLRRM